MSDGTRGNNEGDKKKKFNMAEFMAKSGIGYSGRGNAVQHGRKQYIGYGGRLKQVILAADGPLAAEDVLGLVKVKGNSTLGLKYGIDPKPDSYHSIMPLSAAVVARVAFAEVGVALPGKNGEASRIEISKKISPFELIATSDVRQFRWSNTSHPMHQVYLKALQYAKSLGVQIPEELEAFDLTDEELSSVNLSDESAAIDDDELALSDEDEE